MKSLPVNATNIKVESLRVVGGGGARMTNGLPLFVSFPFAILCLDDEKVVLKMRANWVLKLMLLTFFPIQNSFESECTKWWSATWPEIVKVETSRKGLVFYRQDNLTCKFVAMRHRTNLRVIEFLNSKGVATVKVRSTFFKSVV